MAKYGSDDLSITFGATPMKNYIDEINDIVIEAMLQEGHAFGDAWFEQLASGVKRMEDIVLSGFYDDTGSTGPDAKFNTIGSSAELIITFGASKTITVTCFVRSYTRSPTRGELTRFSVTLAPTGQAQEA